MKNRNVLPVYLVCGLAAAALGSICFFIDPRQHLPVRKPPNPKVDTPPALVASFSQPIDLLPTANRDRPSQIEPPLFFKSAPQSPAPARNLPSALFSVIKSPDARISETVVFSRDSGDRVAAARQRSEAAVRTLFAQAGVRFPAQQIFLRGFKREGELELWAANRLSPWKLVATYAVAALSGAPGPKRAQGDGQVPEGFYEVDRFNPQSNFHLSLGLNYPNAADRMLSDAERPGFDIFIHGNAVSAGCLAMGDDRIEEIYLAALDARAKPIRAHLFPARMNASDWPAWRDEQVRGHPDLDAFWKELQVGYDLFEKEHEVPRVTVLLDGRYHCTSGRR